VVRRYQTGTWLFLAAVTMVFAGFVSAYVVRRGISNDWRPIAKPAILWVNTAVLLASSLTLERARRRPETAGAWLGVTSLLGAIFLIGQFVAWQQLRAAGVYLATNPSSSFFYLLTGAHALHLAGGVAALFYVAIRATMQAGWPGRAPAIEATSLYWHFMDGLWLFVFVLVFIWR
jgi:cytochrome c oxidase subunit 3